MLRAFFRIRWDPRSAHVCIQPITSGIPRDFKKPGSLLGTVPNAPITIGIASSCISNNQLGNNISKKNLGSVMVAYW